MQQIYLREFGLGSWGESYNLKMMAFKYTIVIIGSWGHLSNGIVFKGKVWYCSVVEVWSMVWRVPSSGVGGWGREKRRHWRGAHASLKQTRLPYQLTLGSVCHGQCLKLPTQGKLYCRGVSFSDFRLTTNVVVFSEWMWFCLPPCDNRILNCLLFTGAAFPFNFKATTRIVTYFSILSKEKFTNL
jgi:hypothetical protein